MIEQDRKLIQYIIDGREDKFYNSRRWRKLAKQVKARDDDECQQCKDRGYVGPAECVHHKIEIKDKPMMALTKSNLTALCLKCHNIIHEKYKNNNEKRKNTIISEERW